MAHLWKVGDKAVCIRDTPWELYKGTMPDNPVRFGAVVSVARVIAFDGITWIAFNERPKTAYDAAFFRPVLPAEPCFTEAMRNLKPRVEA